MLWISIIANLGLLGFFKYYNFFIESFASAFSLFGVEISNSSLTIILPIGISFYTFQTLSYSIDVYRQKLEPTKDFIAFCAFVAFFPQLVAGPIERATNLLPQFYAQRRFEYAKAVDGLRQILWGLFKKIVIADNCGQYANLIFSHSSEYSGSTLVVGALFFSFQIYGDFSGYSDIAIGTARLFGFHLERNFAYPYFSRDIAEFWRRWHISLSTWFRDYLYIPFGGNRGNSFQKIRNVLLVFIVSGFWHGANWTFVFWGALHAIFFIPLMLLNTNRNHLQIVSKGRFFPTSRELLQMLLTMGLVSFAWIFFRAESLDHAFSYISNIFSLSLFTIPDFNEFKGIIIFLIIGFLIVEWWGREKEYAIADIGSFSTRSRRWSSYLTLVMMVYFFSNSSESIEFIYFQF